MTEDLLWQRLDSLAENDLKSLLVGGLRVSERKVEGLDHAALVQRCSSALRDTASSSVMKVLKRRGPHGFPYKQLLINVADKLTPGHTPLSWTAYRLGDEHSPDEIEEFIIELFEARARKWWDELPDARKAEFADDIRKALPRAAPLVRQQLLEQVIQGGIVSGLAKVSASGLMGVAGFSVVSQLGWIILVQSLGWMTGLKIAVFGLGGYGAMGGAVTVLGASAIGAAVAVPGLLVWLDGPSYRKLIPTTIMLLAKARLTAGAPPGAAADTETAEETAPTSKGPTSAD
ncbi:MAG: hypothetical protein AAGI11_01940 [Pseudomonadota bacterium]